MSSFKTIVSALSVATLAAGLATAAPRNESRTRAIDLISQGQVLENQGDREGAWQKYSESAQVAPSPSACYHLGRLARLQGQRDIARQWLDRALQLNPSFELAKVELSQLNNGGSSKEAPAAKTMAAELRGDIAPGSTQNLNAPMNVDALRREVVTMQSLAPPQYAGATAADQRAGGRAELAGASIGDSDSMQISSTENKAVVAAETPATPEDIQLPGRRKDANDEVSDILSPTLEASEQGGVSSDDIAAALPAKPAASAAEGDGKNPTREQINDAAFGEASQKDPGSVGYGQSGKVALGTFAFHRKRGDDYREASRWQDAAVEYKQALELSPNDAETRSLLAEMYGRIGANERAQTQFEKAKAQAPADDSIYYKQGNAYFDEQKYDLAIGSYRQALDLNPQNKFALNNMGVAYMEKKDYTRAADKFKQVLKLDPKYEMAVLNLGIIYDEHIVDKAQALKYYDEYLALKGPRATEVQRWADAIRAKSKQ